jgi:hypothetical protein
MGKNTLIYHYLYEWFPFFDRIRYPVKFLFLALLFISLSAGLGYDCLGRGIYGQRRGFRAAIITLLVLATLAAFVFWGLVYFDTDIKGFLERSGYDYPEYNLIEINLYNTKRLLFFFIFTSLAIYGGLRSLRLRKALPFLIVAVLTVDLFFAHLGYYHATRAEDYHKQGEVMEFLKKDTDIFRVFVTPRTMVEKFKKKGVTDDGPLKKWPRDLSDLFKDRLAGYNIEHHIFNIDGMSVMTRGDYEAVRKLLTTQKRPDSTNLMAMLNVKYVVSLPEIESEEFHLMKVLGTDITGAEIEKPNTLKVYENLNYLPRFFTVERFRIIKDPKEYMEILETKGFLPGEEVLLMEEPWEGMEIEAPKEGTKKSHGEPLIKSYRNDSIELLVNMDSPGILVASESYYPGWRVYVDGVERRLLRANLILRAVALETGVHEVRFVYSPQSFKTGAAISTLTIAGLLAAGLLTWLRKLRQ